MAFTYGSLCSGIEAASVAWSSLGWSPAWFSETAPFPKAVLAYHHPDVPDLGDMKEIYDKKEFQERPVDLIVGGTPCQSFSLAGPRGGLDDPRGDLALEFLRIVRAKQPRWFMWENVPAVISSNKGRDFGAFLGSIQKFGYGFAYRILNSQNFGVPQERRRLFVVGNSGGWLPAAKVLFDGEDVLWDTSALGQGEEVQETPVGLGGIAPGGGEGNLGGRKAACIKAGYYKCYNDLENTDNLIVGKRDGRTTIRRLTPLECERLQGFPDNYTRIPLKGRPAERCSDGLRYKAVGNSMAVPVMEWLGKRIQFVDGALLGA